MNVIKKIMLYFSTLILAILTTNLALACTGIQLKAKDGSYVNGRTVEFGINLPLNGLFIPRHYAFKGTLPDGSTGLTYQSKYAAIGANTFGEPAIVDGVNEKGLSIGMFYFPGYAKYAEITSQNKSMALSPVEFPNWILTQFATVDEVKQNIHSVVIAPSAPAGWGFVPPFHYVVYDKTGKSIAIEPINGEIKVFDNPIGVMTNSPTFDWHLTNLANYVNLSPLNAPAKTIDGFALKSFGEGSGLHGLPGDFTPPSRFIRAAVFSSSAVPVDNADQAVLQTFHILNQFDIPVGAVREKNNDKINNEFTLATTVKDPNHLKYYMKTFDDQAIKVMDLRTFNLDGKELQIIPVNGKQSIIDISGNAKKWDGKNNIENSEKTASAS